jgi:hypothetical protein
LDTSCSALKACFVGLTLLVLNAQPEMQELAGPTLRTRETLELIRWGLSNELPRGKPHSLLRLPIRETHAASTRPHRFGTDAS